jgi:hypothetical protein
MTLRWLLDNVKGAEYLVIETKEKELNPFTNKVEGEHKVSEMYRRSETEKYEQYLDKEIEDVYLDADIDYVEDLADVGFWVKLKEQR